MSQAQYNLIVHPTVRETLDSMADDTQTRITTTLQAIAETRQPTKHSKCEMMTNAHHEGRLYKVRCGDFRAIAEFEKPEFRILKVAKRETVYSDIDSIYSDL